MGDNFPLWFALAVALRSQPMKPDAQRTVVHGAAMTLRSYLLRAALLGSLLLAAGGLSAASDAAHQPVPFTASFDAQGLEILRAQLDRGSAAPELRTAKAALLRAAEPMLSVTALSVMDKTGCGASGDKHDFFAIGKLAWPNPKTADGMPWIRRDGPANPAVRGDGYDKARYNLTIHRIQTLVRAWYYSRDERYATKAAQLLRVWFIDPATRMNPNFNHASALPGVHAGMPIGIIEGVVLIELFDHVKLLAPSAAWTEADEVGLRQWISGYMTWLLQSDFGRIEGRATNNHGIWYAAQVAACALYLGERQHVRPMVENARKVLAGAQTPDGGFDSELKRKQSLGYSIYVVLAYQTLARCGAETGDDLWHYESPNGRSLERGVAFLAPYLAGDKAWTWPDIDADKPISVRAFYASRLGAKNYPALAPTLLRAASRAITQNRKDAAAQSFLLMDYLAPTRPTAAW